VRKVLYAKGVYENDLRDLFFYNRVRPKFFASEPASVTFCYALFTFTWLVISRWRWKLPAYLALVALGLFAMPGPTLLLMLLLLVPYLLFLDSRRGGRLDGARFLLVACVATVLLALAAVLAQTLFKERLAAVTSGNDPSFFYRVQGPALAGIDILERYPIAGAGLTGEPFVEREVTNLYLRSPFYSSGWKVVSPATELLINYFWLHWIYLGFVWGVVMLAAVTTWLRVLGVPSPAFCWVAWAILGQASGAYVGPTCWAVMFLAAAGAVLHQRRETTEGAAGALRGGRRAVTAVIVRRLCPLSVDRRASAFHVASAVPTAQLWPRVNREARRPARAGDGGGVFLRSLRLLSIGGHLRFDQRACRR
jgi:hypothetical protein